MTHRDSPGAQTADILAQVPSDGACATTRVDDAQAIEPADFDLDAFARNRRIRILTYSSSIRMLRTVIERFAESHVECELGFSRVVKNVASIIALQTAARDAPARARRVPLARVGARPARARRERPRPGRRIARAPRVQVRPVAALAVGHGVAPADARGEPRAGRRRCSSDATHRHAERPPATRHRPAPLGRARRSPGPRGAAGAGARM